VTNILSKEEIQAKKEQKTKQQEAACFSVRAN